MLTTIRNVTTLVQNRFFLIKLTFKDKSLCVVKFIDHSQRIRFARYTLEKKARENKCYLVNF